MIGFFSSFVGAIAGGGGLISIPLLILIGLPPQIAIATNKLGGVGLSIGSIYKYWKGDQIMWAYTIPLTIVSIAGAYIGANLLLNIDQELLPTIVAVILIFMLPVVFLKKSFGIEYKETTKFKKALGYFLYFLLMIFGGFFGGGAGILAISTLVTLFGFNIIKASATDMVPWFFLSLFTLAIFALNGIVDYQIGLALFVGMLLGGYLGAHTAIGKGTNWVKGVFVVITIASIIKLLFFN